MYYGCIYETTYIDPVSESELHLEMHRSQHAEEASSDS